MTATTETRTRLRPSVGRLVVRRVEAHEMTAGGIVLPDNAREKPCEGVVLAVGDAPWRNGREVSVPVCIDDRVLFARYAGTETEHDGEKVLIMAYDDVLAVIEEVA